MLTLFMINKHDTSLYSLVNHENKIVRLYHKDYGTSIHYNEFCYYLDFLIPLGYNFYIIYNNPIHNKFFTDEDLKFLNMNIDYINTLDAEPTHSETIQFFKEEKEKLLLFLEDIHNLYFYFFVPRLSVNNEFYYDLLLLFKDDHDIKNVSGYFSTIVSVDKILYLNNLNYSLNFFKLFFNFEDQTFNNNFLNKFQSKIFNKKNKNLHKWPETIAFNNCEQGLSITNESKYNFLKKQYYDKLNNSYNRTYYKKMAYQTLCKNWWIINNDWNIHPEFIFYCDIYKSANITEVSFDENGEVTCKNYLEWGSFFESLSSFSKDYNFFTGEVKLLK